MQILNLTDEIQISKKSNKTQINRKLNSENITVSIDTKGEELFYQLKFPLRNLTFIENQLPSLGISIEGLKRPSSSQRNLNGGGRPAGVGGGRPSGTGGGRPAGVGGGRPSGNTSETSPFASMSDDINIWFLLELSPKS